MKSTQIKQKNYLKIEILKMFPPTYSQFKVIALTFSNKNMEKNEKFQQKLPSISAIRQSRGTLMYKKTECTAKTKLFL